MARAIGGSAPAGEEYRGSWIPSNQDAAIARRVMAGPFRWGIEGVGLEVGHTLASGGRGAPVFLQSTANVLSGDFLLLV